MKIVVIISTFIFFGFTIITAKNLINYIITKYSNRIWKDYSKDYLLSKSLLYYILEFSVSLWVFIGLLTSLWEAVN